MISCVQPGPGQPPEPADFMDRRAFMKLQVSQRRKILQEQTARMKSVNERDTDIRELGGGDFDAD